jgi:hypothetical protein
MRTIQFKKILLGKWTRTDGDSKERVTEEAMHREIQKLLWNGWHMRWNENLIVQTITMYKG